MHEPIITYLKRRLREAGPQRWEAIASAAPCSIFTLRKVAYGDTPNPGVVTVQPLLDFFQAVDRGEKELPAPVPAPEPAKAA